MCNKNKDPYFDIQSMRTTSICSEEMPSVLKCHHWKICAMDVTAAAADIHLSTSI